MLSLKKFKVILDLVLDSSGFLRHSLCMGAMFAYKSELLECRGIRIRVDRTILQYIRLRNMAAAAVRVEMPIRAMGQNWDQSRSKEAPCRKTDRTMIRK